MHTLVAWYKPAPALEAKMLGCGWEQRRWRRMSSPASSTVCGGVRQRGGASSRVRCLNPLKQKLSELACQTSKEQNFTMLSTLVSAIGGPKVERSFQSISSIGQVLHLAVWLLRNSEFRGYKILSHLFHL